MVRNLFEMENMNHGYFSMVQHLGMQNTFNTAF